MTLYRIDWEWDEDDRFGYKIVNSYEYVAGDARLGRAVYCGVMGDRRPVEIHRLGWSLHALWVCLHGVEDKEKNLTYR